MLALSVALGLCLLMPRLRARHAEDAGFPEACFKIPYDYLVLGVG